MEKLTPFGKELRKIRIDRDEKQKDMAENLNVSKMFLSYLERGQRKIPDDLPRKVGEMYNLSDEDYTSLTQAYFQTKGMIKISLTDKSKEDVNLLLKLVRVLDKLSSEEKKEIITILNKARDTYGSI